MVGPLYNFRNRDYSPTLGRWMQQDPVGYDGGNNNLYGFIGNQPTNGLDAYGLGGPDSLSQAIEKCLALPTIAQRIECLKTATEGLNPGDREVIDQIIKSEQELLRPVSRFCRQKLGQQIKEYKNLWKTLQEHLQKYCQKAGKTSGECNRIERQLAEYRKILQCRGREFGPNGELLK